MRTLLALALFAPVAFGQDDDSVPVAPAPRLKTLPTTKKKVVPPIAVTPKVEAQPKPVTKVEPMPKASPVPEPSPKTVAKVDPPTPTPTPPKAEPPVEPKAEPKTDAKVETKDEKPVAAVPAAKAEEPSFNDWTAPLYAVIAYGVLAVLVMIRSFVFPRND